MTCKSCRCPMRTETAHEAATPAERAAWRAQGGGAHRGRGLCDGCYKRATAEGTLANYERLTVPGVDLLQEWRHLADPAAPLRRECVRLAPRLGMDPGSLEKALRRAGVTSRWTGGAFRMKGAA